MRTARERSPAFLLRVLKLVHTVIWAFFVIAIFAVWVFAASGIIVGAIWAIAVVLLEVAILGFHRGQCPLGKIAERFTDNRAKNFDIYLPAWLAGRTKSIFGSLLFGGVVLTALRWATMKG